MPKENGLDFTVTIDDAAGTPRDITNEVTNMDLTTPRGVIDVTGMDKSSLERVLGLSDGQVTLRGGWSDDSNLAFDVFKTVSSSDVIRTVTIVVSGQTLAMEMLITNYAIQRNQDGGLFWTGSLMLQNGTDPTWS